MKFSIALAAATIALWSPVSAQDATKPAAPAKAASKVVTITVAEAETLIASGVTVIDLRSEEEYEATHIKGAKNISAISADFEKNIAALDPTKPILVHCQSGRRSRTAIEGPLGKAKVPTIYHLAEGLSAWQKMGKPVVKTPTPAQSGILPDRLK